MLILASASPRRHELLTQAGLDFTWEAPNVLEDLRSGEAAAVYVARLAVEKANAVRLKHAAEDTPSDPLYVLGADTCVLAAHGEILGKPADEADARRMLGLLAGRTHQVLTGVAVVTAGGVVSDVEITQVTFDLIDEAELTHYLATGEPLDKAGAYGIQGYAARWIPRIEGCFFNVMGLPIARTIALLAQARSTASAGRTGNSSDAEDSRNKSLLTALLSPGASQDS